MKKINNLVLMIVIIIAGGYQLIMAMDEIPHNNGDKNPIFNATVAFDCWTDSVKISSIQETNPPFEPFRIGRGTMRTMMKDNPENLYSFVEGNKRSCFMMDRKHLKDELDKEAFSLAKDDGCIITGFRELHKDEQWHGEDGLIEHYWTPCVRGDEKDTHELNIGTHPFWIQTTDKVNTYLASELSPQFEPKIRDAIDKQKPFILTLSPTYPATDKPSAIVEILIKQFSEKPQATHDSGSGNCEDEKVHATIKDKQKYWRWSPYIVVSCSAILLGILFLMYQKGFLELKSA